MIGIGLLAVLHGVLFFPGDTLVIYAVVVAIAAAIWLGLSAFAFVWMRHARFGPLEWGLRSFTYRRRQPLRARAS